MSGKKNAGNVTSGIAKTSTYSSSESVINFAVPGVSILRKTDVEIPKVVMPGVIPAAVDISAKQKGKKIVLSMDA